MRMNPYRRIISLCTFLIVMALSGGDAAPPYPCSTNRNVTSHSRPDTHRYRNSDAYLYAFTFPYTHC
jgi:hypothetical protein